MLQTYNTNFAVTNGMTIPFSGKTQTSNSATLASDGETINLNTYGVYEVSVNAYGSSTAGGAVGLQLYGDGTAIANAQSSTVTEAATNGAISFQTIVKVAPTTPNTQAELTLQYTGTTGAMSLVNMIVKKVQ